MYTDEVVDDMPLLSTEFIKKYIQYAKTKVSPAMGEEAAAKISAAYADLRSRGKENAGRTLPITARTLETIIRLASAHAKCHLRSLVTEADAQAALKLLHFALFSEDTVEAPPGEIDEAEIAISEADGTSRKRSTADAGTEGAGRGGAEDARRRQKTSEAISSGEMVAQVERALGFLFAGGIDDVPFEELWGKMVTIDARVEAAGRDAVNQALEGMQEENLVMFREGRVHLI